MVELADSIGLLIQEGGKIAGMLRFEYQQHGSIQYIKCPYCKAGNMIRYAYDAAKCPDCGVEEAYIE